jgi:competence protein ComEC
MLVLDPRMVRDIGFQLSVCATAGLLAWATPVDGWLRGRLPSAVPDWLVGSLGVSLAAQAATLPLVLFHFGRLSLVSPVANLIVAPLVAPAMLASLLGLACGAVLALGAPAALFSPVTLLATLPLRGMVVTGQTAAALPFASVSVAEEAAGGVAGALAIVLLLCGTHRGRALLARAVRRRAAGTPVRPVAAVVVPGTPPRTRATGTRRLVVALSAGGIASLAVATSLAGGLPQGRLRLTMLDVGQGDAILLEGDRGSRVLVDGGPDPDRLLALLDERIPAWDRRIELVVLTHPHEDHVAGLALLLERYRVDAVAEPGMLGPGPGDRAFRGALAARRTRQLVLAAGDRFGIDGATAEVRWPRPGSVPSEPPDEGSSINNVSVVLDVRFGERRALLAGDAEEEVDPALLAGGADTVDVLKVAHHGSRSATTQPFLDAVRPRVALVSAGRGNPYGHPARETLERLETVGARVYRADTDGTVTVSTDGLDLRVSSSGGRVAGGSGPGTVATVAESPSAVAPSTGFHCDILLAWASRRPEPGDVRGPRGAPEGSATRVRGDLGSPPVASVAGAPWDPCYDRRDVHPRPGRVRGAARGAASQRRDPPPLGGRRRRRSLPRGRDPASRHRRGPCARRERGPPPRRRQGPPG